MVYLNAIQLRLNNIIGLVSWIQRCHTFSFGHYACIKHLVRGVTSIEAEEADASSLLRTL